MRCKDCGANVVSAGLVYCPKCSYPLNGRSLQDARRDNIYA